MHATSRLSQFRRLHDRNFGLVWHVLGQAGLSGSTREDAAQEVWLTAFRRLDSLHGEGSERAWLCSIARKMAWRVHRDARRFDRRVQKLARQPEHGSPDLERSYAAATTVDSALAALPETQRQVLLLSQVHGMTAPEIAEGLDIPLNTVYSRLRLARQRLDAFADELSGLDDGDAATSSQLRRSWVLLVPRLAAKAGGVASAGAGKLAGLALGAMVGASALGIWVGVSPADPAPAAAEAAPTVAAIAPTQASAGTTRPAPSPAAAPPAPQSTTAETPTEPAAAKPTRLSRPLPKASPTPDKVSETPAPANATVELDAEARLLERAQRALNRGDAKTALAHVEEHRRRFERGLLADVRRGVHVRALCDLGRPEQARTAARELAQKNPDSAVGVAVADVCAPRDGSKSTNSSK